jgi:hypothetical protein
MKKLKIFQQGFAGHDWGFKPYQFVDAATALMQPYSIAAVMVMCNEPGNFSYSDEVKDLDLSRFDLVLMTSIEFVSTGSIKAWASKNKIQNYLVAQGCKQSVDTPEDNVIYRPWWAFNIVNSNEPEIIDNVDRPYLFECLLGARRPHRDFAMLNFQESGLLDQSIVTYRDVFYGNTIDQESADIANKFALPLQHPYVSPNLDTSWESSQPVTNRVSSLVPWEIYRRCNYTVLCETQWKFDEFFFSEKTGKATLGQRLFVHIGSQNFLKQLHALGFETFGDIIDESYDSITDNFQRFTQAFEQVKLLAKQNHNTVLHKVSARLLHNRQRMIDLQTESKQRMADRINLKIQSSI